MSRTGSSVVLYIAAMFMTLSSSTSGQSGSPHTVGPMDGDIVVPQTTGALGQKDAAALAELANHLAVVGSTPWGGMQGTGTITFAQDSTTYSATLSNLGDDLYRLDAQLAKGPMSIRIHHMIGKIQDSDGTVSIIPPDTASLGLFPFELLRNRHFPRAVASLIDHGIVSVGGARLHRITMEIAATGQNPATKSKQTSPIDLYFDPTSHLLLKSAVSIRVAKSRPVDFLSVVTYSDYRRVGASIVPFCYTETLEGLQYRTLQLSEVQLNPALGVTYFEF